MKGKSEKRKRYLVIDEEQSGGRNGEILSVVSKAKRGRSIIDRKAKEYLGPDGQDPNVRYPFHRVEFPKWEVEDKDYYAEIQVIEEMCGAITYIYTHRLYMQEVPFEIGEACKCRRYRAKIEDRRLVFDSISYDH